MIQYFFVAGKTIHQRQQSMNNRDDRVHTRERAKVPGVPEIISQIISHAIKQTLMFESGSIFQTLISPPEGPFFPVSQLDCFPIPSGAETFSPPPPPLTAPSLPPTPELFLLI